MATVTGPVGVVGLGYVGLPLAAAFARHLRVVGYDVNTRRIDELRQGIDGTGEVQREDLQQPNLVVTADPQALKECPFVIIAVPTPVDAANVPDLDPLRRAVHTVGKNLRPGATVIIESTVYPGVTEEICQPILTECSGMKPGEFHLGYSPERINPGDQEHTVDKIVKVVSGNDAATLEKVAALYGLIVRSVFRAPNIMTAEAAKVIENIQRDLNIALMNELSLIFGRLGLHTDEVLAAAATKWNFHKYHPGLVGGHCIGVDPYYLTYRAEQLGYHPQVILAGRRLNDSMALRVGTMVTKAIAHAGKPLRAARVLVLGLTFKENVPDIRNSRVHDTIKYLQDFGVEVIGCDPLLSADAVRRSFGIENVTVDRLPTVDAVLVANKHQVFRDLTLEQLGLLMDPPVLIDIKNRFDRRAALAAGFYYESL